MRHQRSEAEATFGREIASNADERKKHARQSVGARVPRELLLPLWIFASCDSGSSASMSGRGSGTNAAEVGKGRQRVEQNGGHMIVGTV